jgi:release factor glutamine methyltransferase
MVATIAARLGSAREATWIVEHGGTARAPALAERREAGEPLQYVLGRWPFRSVDLRVDPRVLIPRPETEQLVEVALGELDGIDGRSAGGRGAAREHRRRGGPAGHAATPRRCADLGTGSGAIALALATEGGATCPGIEVWATDDSVDALTVAGENLRHLATMDAAAAGRVRLAQGSWFDALPTDLAGGFDLIVSNPPYVAESEYERIDPTVRRWEPKRALVAAAGAGGVGGMAAIEAVIAGAPRWLRRPGALVVEIDPRQAQASLAAAGAAGFVTAATRRDLAGRVRILVARW